MSQTLEELLGSIEGLGPAKAQTVLDNYDTVEVLAKSDQSDLCALPGIGKETARRILHAATAIEDPTDVAALTHADKRKNIPTDEQAHLVDLNGDGTPDTLLYQRDADLDPQLVWRGKDVENLDDLSVPVAPIYIQEKVDPRVLVENLRNTSASGHEPEMTLFDMFDGIEDPFDKIEFYEHDANWSNRMILGDALVSMTSLAGKEDLKGKVQTIYFDPPYGIKFQSNWQVSTRQRSVADGKDISRQPEQVRAFRDTWKDGIHSYLTYLRDRLMAARTLLTESGSIFVQIGDENLHVVRALLDEVFGPENFVSLITFKKTSSASSVLLGGVVDYLVWFTRDKNQMKYRQLYLPKTLGEEGADQYRRVRLADGETRPATKTERAGLDPLPEGAQAYRMDNLTSAKPDLKFPFEMDGKTYTPGKNFWKTGEVGMERLRIAGRLVSTGDRIHYLRYLDDFGAIPLNNIWTDTIISGYSVADAKNYVVQTASRVVERCILMTSDPGDLVLDPTCGSGTTAYSAEKWGRRWITMDTSRVALALARQRLMGSRFPYYLLADSEEGARAEEQQSGQEHHAPTGGWGHDVRRGFVYERALHIMLSTIANCEELRDGMAEVEADKAVRRTAESEVLYDKPVEDRKRVRVAGPFTVESLSPHRTVDAHAESAETSTDFVNLVLTNLSRAGVQNGYKDERLNLAWLEPHAGKWVHAVGGFTDADGNDQTVAVSIGPEAGTVGREHVAEAAQEALKDVRADLLLVCAYAFDAGAGEQALNDTSKEHAFNAGGERRVGRLRVLNVRVNVDLMMGDELKNTGAGNLFMVFGEPDITLDDQGDGTVSVTLNGLDIYDPNRQEVRPSDPDDIACWFIDTNYDDKSFFVRHAYFTGGGNDPFDALKKALKAEIDLDAWSALYRTTSLPFEKPATGRIAVKAINHFGDEAMRVFDVA